MDLQTDLSVSGDEGFTPTPSASMSAILAIWLVRGLADEAAGIARTTACFGFPSHDIDGPYDRPSYMTGFRSAVTMCDPMVFGIGGLHAGPPEPISECDVITACYNRSPELGLNSAQYHALSTLMCEYDQAVGHLGVSGCGVDPLTGLQNMDPLAFDDPALHMRYETGDHHRDVAPCRGLDMYDDQWMNTVFALFGVGLDPTGITDAMASSCIAMPQELLDWWPQGDDQRHVTVSWPYGWDRLNVHFLQQLSNTMDDTIIAQRLHRLLLRAMYMCLQNKIAAGSPWDLDMGSMCDPVYQSVLAHGDSIFAQADVIPSDVHEGSVVLCGPDATDEQLCSLDSREIRVMLGHPIMLSDGRILIGLRAGIPVTFERMAVTHHTVLIDPRTRCIRKESDNA